MMSAVRVAVASLAVVVAMGGHVQGAIVNGGFETGDLTGWTASHDDLVEVATSYVTLGSHPMWEKSEEHYFAVLETGLPDTYTTLSQQFQASEGDIISFDVFFATTDPTDRTQFNDDGFVNLILGTETPITLYSKSVALVGTEGKDGWHSVSHTFSTAGMYKIEAGIRNVQNAARDSYIGLGNIQHNVQNQAVPAVQAVPEPASIVIWSVVFLSGLGINYRRRRQKQSA